VDYWKTEKPNDYTQAINLALKNFYWANWDIDYYYDMASFEDYQKFLEGRKDGTIQG